VLPPEMLGTGDYMAPEIVKGRLRPGSAGAKPSIYTDLHSLAVLIYELLLMRHPLKGPKHHDQDAEKDDLLALGERALYIEDPIDKSNRPVGAFNGAWLLGEEVEALMRRAFTIGLRNPTQRPLAAEWGDALIRMIEQTVPCANPNCEGKAFVLLRDKPAVCPWCQTRVTQPKQVPVLRMYDGTGQSGHFQTRGGKVVGWQKRTLHRWHIQPGYSERTAKSDDERRPMAEFQVKQGKWLLENLAMPDLRVVMRSGVRRVGIDETLPLEEGQQLMLGSSRLAFVAMQKL
jgi:serine/threonine protein kinase